MRNAPQLLLKVTPKSKTPTISSEGSFIGGPSGTWTPDQRIMLTTTAFTACFQFVVWTVSCLYDLPVQSLHLPATSSRLGSGLPRCKQHRLPRIWVVLHASRANLLTCNPFTVDHGLCFRSTVLKSSALTNWANGPKLFGYYNNFFTSKPHKTAIYYTPWKTLRCAVGV